MSADRRALADLTQRRSRWLALRGSGALGYELWQCASGTDREPCYPIYYSLEVGAEAFCPICKGGVQRVAVEVVNLVALAERFAEYGIIGWTDRGASS